MESVEEDAFWDKLRGVPDDTDRLVFADWLDEHDRNLEAAGMRELVRLAIYPGQAAVSEWGWSSGPDKWFSVLPWRWRLRNPGVLTTGSGRVWMWPSLKEAYLGALSLYPGNDWPVTVIGIDCRRASAWASERGIKRWEYADDIERIWVTRQQNVVLMDNGHFSDLYSYLSSRNKLWTTSGDSI